MDTVWENIADVYILMDTVWENIADVYILMDTVWENIADVYILMFHIDIWTAKQWIVYSPMKVYIWER